MTDRDTTVSLGDNSPGADPEGSAENVPGILGGAQIVKVRRPEQDDLWFAQYEYPPGSGQFLLFQFESVEQIKQTIGKDFNTSGEFTILKRREAFLKRDTVDIVGTATDVTGQNSRFDLFMDDLMYSAALEAGLRDPGQLGKFLANPEIQLIIAKGSIGEWTPERIQGEVRNTDFYQTVLYPGINHFLSQGIDNPEQEYKRYMTNVTQALDLLGVQPDPDGSYRQAVGELLTRGVDDQLFLQMTPAFVKARGSGAYADILNQWTEETLGKTLSFDDLFDVFEGSATDDLLQVVETANLQFAAEQEGVTVGKRRLERIAAETNLTEAQAQAAFGTVEQQLLALDRVILDKRFGLQKGELIDAAAGIAPKSGRSIQEIRNLARKAATEEGLLDDDKKQLFVGFNPRTGTPFRPGLNPLSPEGA